MKAVLMHSLIWIQIGYMIGALAVFIKGGTVIIDGTFLVIPLLFLLVFFKEEVVGLLKL